jgi:hypothetical protein
MQQPQVQVLRDSTKHLEAKILQLRHVTIIDGNARLSEAYIQAVGSPK